MKRIIQLAVGALCVFALGACDETETAKSARPKETKQQKFDRYNKHAVPAIDETSRMLDAVSEATESGEFSAIVTCNNQTDKLPSLRRQVLKDVPDEALEDLLSDAYDSLADGLRECGNGNFAAAGTYIETYGNTMDEATTRVKELS